MKHETTDDLSDTSAVVEKHLAVHGKVHDPNAGYALCVGRPGEPLARALKIPFHHLAPSSGSQLVELLMRGGHVALINECGPKEIAAALRKHAQATKTWVIERPGIHTLDADAVAMTVIVVHGRAYALTTEGPRDLAVKLAGAAALEPDAKRDLAHFNRQFAPVLAANPRMLVVVSVALAALLARLFNHKPLCLLLVGQSSRGKSLVQSLALDLVVGQGTVISLNATPVGLHDLLADRPDQPVFLDDVNLVHSAPALFSAIMDVGNGAGRIRARSTTRDRPVEPVTSTLIMSAERGLAETARLARQPLNAGIFARVFEMGLGEHGIFDDLCGEADGSALAKYIAKAGPEYRGVLGAAFLDAVSADWSRVQRLHDRNLGTVRAAIEEAADGRPLDALSGRLLDGLAFAAFAGCLASTLGVLDVPRKRIKSAFRLVFGEHLERLTEASTPIAEEAIGAVRHFIQTNPARFLPLAQASGPQKVNNLAGYIKVAGNGSRLYLFFPGTFREEFADEYGREVYTLLKEAGFLSAQKNRHNLTMVRLPGPDDEKGRRQDFVAIRESILDSSDAN
jgi:Domain of unknown function (DUF927)